jgi:hypothetical protein
MRTLVQMLERERGLNRVTNHTMFYFTDNLVMYYVIQGGSSTSPELHRLVLCTKLLELELGCHLEVIHVPGTLMICQGTDGLSRGLWLAPSRMQCTLLLESSQALAAAPFQPAGIGSLGHCCVRFFGYGPVHSHDFVGGVDFSEYIQLPHNMDTTSGTLNIG